MTAIVGCGDYQPGELVRGWDGKEHKTAYSQTSVDLGHGHTAVKVIFFHDRTMHIGTAETGVYLNEDDTKELLNQMKRAWT